MKFLKALKEKIFRKKVIIPVCVVLVLAIGVMAFFMSKNKNKPQAPKAETRTTVLEKTSLSDTVSVNGKVDSVSVVNVTTQANYKVSEIFVKVGDKVKKGDIIAKLDTTDILKEIADINEKIKQANESTQETIDKAKKSSDEAYKKLVDAQTNYKNSKAVFDGHKNILASANATIKLQQDAYNAAVTYRDQKGAEDNVAQQTVAVALLAMNNAKAAWDTAVLNNAADAATKEIEYNTAKATYDKAVADYNSSDIKKMYEDAKTAVGTAQTALDNAKISTNYNGVIGAYSQSEGVFVAMDGALATTQQMYETAIEALKTAQKTKTDTTLAKQLSDLNEKRAQCVLKAENDGVVTALNATVGSVPIATAPVAVIQDTDNLIVTASIKEYDIKNIAIGQKVTIKSDATGETEIQGIVSQIGMTANGAQGSTEVTYPIEIKVVTKNSGLLIGMNVKSEIILSEKNGIFVVPDDAIGLNGMGDKVVYRKRGEDFIPVVVTTGEENDFYTQIISDELVEGMEIRASADEGGAAMLPNDDMQSSAEMGGAPAGGMAMTMG